MQNHRLARRAIQLLEKAINDEFGLQVKMGAELEYTLHDASGQHINLPLPYDAKAELKTDLFNIETSNGARLRQSPIVRSHYKEMHPGQHEITFSHEPEHNHGCAFLADAIARTKTIIEREAPIRCNAVPPYFNTLQGFTNGMHLSVSLWANGANKLAENISSAPHTIYFSDLVSTAMLPSLQENMLMFAPSQNSLARYAGYSSTPTKLNTTKFSGTRTGLKEMAVGTDCITVMPDSIRVENRLPGADTDPHWAITATLSALYHGLRLVRDHPNHPLLTSMRQTGKAQLAAIPTTHQEVINAFSQNTMLTSTLNRLSGDERLGDTLQSQILSEVATGHPGTAQPLRSI